MNPKNSTPKNLGRGSVVPNATVVRVAGPEDLLAYIPYRLGFEPVESVVAVSLTGPRQRVGLVARVDLADLRLRQPDDPDGPDGAATARWLSDHVVADGADRAVVVLYTATDPTVPSGAARRAVALLRARLERRLPGTEVLARVADGLPGARLRRPDVLPRRGQAAGRAQGQPGSRPHGAGGPHRGRHPRGAVRPATRAGGGPDPGAPGGRALDRHLPAAPERNQVPGRRRADRRRGADRPHDTAPGRGVRRATAAERAERALAEWGAESLGLWRSAVRVAAGARPGQPAVLSPVDLGKIGAALADTPVRDAVLLSLAPGTEETALRTARRAVDGDTDQATGAVMARIVDPEQGVPPDEDITRAARHVLEAVVTHVPRNRRAPAYLLLALVAWWHGDGGLAAERVSDALGVDQDYRLALLLRGAIVGGVPPGWVRREQALFHGEPEPEEAAAV